TLGALVTVVVLGVAGLSAQQKPAKGAGSGDDPAIAKARSAYQTAATTQDAAAIAKLYAPDGMEMPPNAPAAKGRAAIEAYHKSFSQQFMVHGLTITPTETHVHGDVAMDIGTYKQQLMANKGGGIIDDTGKYVVLLRKDASGAWLLTHVIYNSDVPL